MKDLITWAEIPPPVLFNVLKHHRNYILDAVNSESLESLAILLEPICNNYVDVYFGEMTPEAIASSIISVLGLSELILPGDFNNWIANAKGYRKIALDDGSEWIIRKSDDKERYIHLHPARSGLLTFRFRGSALKTICLLKAGISDAKESVTLGKVNKARSFIGLSPIKSLERNKGITSSYSKFFDIG